MLLSPSEIFHLDYATDLRGDTTGSLHSLHACITCIYSSCDLPFRRCPFPLSLPHPFCVNNVNMIVFVYHIHVVSELINKKVGIADIQTK